MERDERQQRERAGRYALAVVLLAISYALAGRLGQLAALPPGNVSPIWPASGLALAAILRFGSRYWPGVWLGSFAVNYAVEAGTGNVSAAAIAGIACVATGAAISTLIAARLLREEGDTIFSRATGVARFAFTGLLAALIAATIGTASFVISGVVERSFAAESWITWVLGDAVGLLVVAPLLLVWSRPSTNESALSRSRKLEAAAVFIVLIAVCVVVFSIPRYPLFFVLIPFLLTTAFRYRQRGAALAIVIVSSISIFFTALRIGPFATAGLSRNESLLLLQGFTGVICLTMLFLSAVLAERQQREREVREAELKLQLERFSKTRIEEELRTAYIVASSGDMIWRQSPDGLFLYVSHASLPLLGYEPQELVGRSVYDYLSDVEANEIRELQAMLMAKSGKSTLTYRVRRKNGDYVWFETTSRAIHNGDDIEEIVNVSREITDRKTAEQHIEHQVYHDTLTDLPNRMLLEDRASVALSRARRNNTLVAVMFLDLDRFKTVNDSLGHATGDLILQAAAKRLAASVRGADTLARIGGDEFVMLVGDLTEAREAVVVAKKVIASMQAPFFAQLQEIYLGISVGISLFPVDGMDVETLLRCADRAMYGAKLLGGSSYQIHTVAMSERNAEVSALESDLRHAIERNELEVFYQPQLDLRTGETNGAEALVRWRHPTRGLMLPDSFIPLAEDARIILSIGEFVLERVCRDLTNWIGLGLPEIRVAVNLSAIEFQDRRLVEMIRAILERTGAPARLLELEITETALMHNAERTLDMLTQLKAMGLQLVVDDFGIGYSSLSYLERFPVDSVKIDRSFVSGIDARGGDAAIISAVVQLAKALNLRVVAEGVESEDQLRLLQAENCFHGQGFLFGRPMAADAFQTFLAAGNSRMASPV